MKIEVRTNALKTSPAIDDHLESRVQRSLGRLNHRVKRVVVYLKDLNGPRGGVDKECAVHIHRAGRPPILVQKRDVDLYQAISNAVASAGLALRKSRSRAA